jgi:hypothetical protein
VSEISQELVERMVAVVREYTSTGQPNLLNGRSVYAEAQAIAELLPVPVDPDWEEALRIIRDDENYWSTPAFEMRDGSAANLVFKALKRGRELSGERP